MNDAERNYYEALGCNLKAARKAAGLTQADVAAFMKVQRTSITNKETGKQLITVWDLVAHLQAVQCSACRCAT